MKILFPFLGLLLALGFAAAAFGQGTAEPGEAVPEEADAPADAARGILPVPDYSGDWKTRAYLTGDWGGLRHEWAEKGVTFDLRWLQVGQGVAAGGLGERWAYATNLDYFIHLDLDRMGVLPGALISFRAQSRFGSTVNADTGLLLPVNSYSYFPLTSPLDRDVPFTITELNYLQFVSEELGFLVGKITTFANTNEFAGGEGRSQFMNFQLMWSSVMAQLAPYSTLAVGGVWLPTPNISVNSALMNLQDASTTTGFDDFGDGASWSTSVDAQYQLGSLPGGTTLGVTYAFDGDFGRITGVNIDPGLGISLERRSETWAVFLSGWQYLYLEDTPPPSIDPSDGRQDLEGLGAFLILGVADRDTNPVSWALAAGLSGRGMIPGRGDDTYGFGYFFNARQDPRSFALDPLAGSSQGLEAYYNLAITQAIALTLDLQWTRSALRRVDDALVLGARLDLAF